MTQRKLEKDKGNKSKGSKNTTTKKARRGQKKASGAVTLNNAEKRQKRFMYQNFTKARCYNCEFAESNFDYVCFRGASMKSCRFYGGSFKGTEFIGSNLKESQFVNAVFEDTVFEGAKLKDANFKGATFKNVIFLMTDTGEAKNLNLEDEGIRVIADMPELDLSDPLREVLEKVMVNKFVKKSRVLDTRDGSINYMSVQLLLERFDEETIIKGLQSLEEVVDRDFYTLSFIINIIKKVEKS